MPASGRDGALAGKWPRSVPHEILVTDCGAGRTSLEAIGRLPSLH